jgi:hypothetical protein
MDRKAGIASIILALLSLLLVGVLVSTAATDWLVYAGNSEASGDPLAP